MDKVHIVLGKKSCDLDSLISALTYAYYLEKVSPPNILCLPVVNVSRREFCYHTETRFILEELNIPESLHVFRDEINLYQLNNEGKLSLTLVNSSALTSEDKSLESAIVRVIGPEEQCDGNLELLESASSLVAKELLQKAPELITRQLAHLLRGSILFQAMAMDPERITEAQEEVLSSLEKKFPELPPREDIITILREAQFHADGLRIEEAVLKDLKEVSDGVIKVAVSTVYMNLEICCELEECQNPCLELDPLEYGCDQLLIYQQENSIANCDEIFLLMKDVISRRHPEMAPNSRTSSTEAVAGSAPLSQGSSGIMELYGSDIEPQPSVVNFIENPQDNNGAAQAHADVNIDLVSPDSGLATIRSSRSSKESSVFLSDDSPVAEGAVSHHSFLSGFDSYSPIPEGAVAEDEKPQSRNSSDNFDLFNFDLVPMATVQTESSHSVDCSSADDFSHDSGSSEEQQPADLKVTDKKHISEHDIANYSTDFPVTRNEEGIEKSDGCSHQQENSTDFSEEKSGSVDLDNDSSSCPELLKSVERRTPPTPTNSLVETSPLDSGPPLFYPQDIIKKINEIDHVRSSQSCVRYGSWWDDFELEPKNADTWSLDEPESVFQSPDSWKDYKASLLLRQQTDRRASDSVCVQKPPKHMGYSRRGIWEERFNLAQNEHTLGCQQKENEPQREDFANMWKSSQTVSAISDQWGNTSTTKGHIKTNPPNVWSEFDHDDSGQPESTWNVPQVEFDHISQRNLDTWDMSKCLSELSADNECERLNNQINLGSRNQKDYTAFGNPKSDTGSMQDNVKLSKEHQNGTVYKSKQFANADRWDMYDSNVRKEVFGNFVSWEDPFLSYRDTDFNISHTGEDLVVSPPDTNYSTSDSYTSPTGVGDEREIEVKHSDRESNLDQTINASSDEPETYDLANEKSVPEASVCSSDSRDGNRLHWQSSLNNENQVKAAHSVGKVVTDRVSFDSEQKGATYFSDDYCVDENSATSSEDTGMMLISTQENGHSSLHNAINIAEEKSEMGSGVIPEDVFPHCGTTDTESTVSVSDLGEGNEQSEQGTKLLGTQWDQWDEQLQHNSYAILEQSGISSASIQGVMECKRTGEGSEQVTLNPIRDECMENDNALLSLLLPLSYVNNSEESRTNSMCPSSPEKTRASRSLTVAAEPSERSIPFPVHELKQEECSASNEECFAVSPREDNEYLAHNNIADHPTHSLSFSSTPVSKHFDKELNAQLYPEIKSPSSGSSREENNQDKDSLLLDENQGIWNKLEDTVAKLETSSSLLLDEAQVPKEECQELLSKESVSIINMCKIGLEIPGNISEVSISSETSLEDNSQGRTTEIPHSPYVEHTEAPDTRNSYTIKKSLSSEFDSSERSETSESLESKIPSEECIDIEPHHELSQILNAWNVSVNEKAQSAGESTELSKVLEFSDTAYNVPGNLPVKNAYKEENTYSGSACDYTHSSATSPDISDSSTNMQIWDSLQAANKEKEHPDDWDLTSEAKMETSGKESLEDKSQENSETSTDHKVPKNLDFWNAHVEDETVSSLSSAGIEEDPEYSNVHQSDLQLEKLDADMGETEYLQSHETTHAIDSENSAVQPNLEESVHRAVLNQSSESVNACHTSREEYGHEISEFSVCQETIQGEIHAHTSQMSAINHEENYASKTSDAWDILLQSNSENTLDKIQTSIEEDLGFQNDSSEWWNVEKRDSSMEDQQLNSSNDSKIIDNVAIACDTWGVHTEINEDTNPTDAALYGNESTQYNSEGKCKNGEHSLAKKNERLDYNTVNCKECDPLSPSCKGELNVKLESFTDADKDEEKQLDPEDGQSGLLNALGQVDPALVLLGYNLNATSSNQNKENIVNSFDQIILGTKEKIPSNSSLPLKTTRSSNVSYNEDKLLQENSFVPDILQNNTPGDCQTFTVEPDLWTDVEQPLLLRTNGENPDILNHCDQDSSSQASSSPDVCHECESKQTCAQASVLAEPEEATQMSPMLSDAYKDTGFDFNQPPAIDREELHPEGNSPCSPNNYETDIGDSYQLTPPTTEEPSKIGEATIMQESDITNKTTIEQGSVSESDNQISTFDHIAGVVDQLEILHMDINIGEVGRDHNITQISLTNPPAMLEHQSEERTETHAALTKKHSLQASLEEEKEDSIYGTEGQYATNIRQELENMLEHHSPWFIESPDKESPLVCTSPFDLSIGTEYTLQTDDTNFSESNILELKAEDVECSQPDQGWGSLLIESDETPGSSCTLKRFEYDTDSSNIESSAGCSEIDISESKAIDVNTEATECIQEDQGWGSLLLESDKACEPSCALKEFDHEIESSNTDSSAAGGERTLSEPKPSNASGKQVAS
ncbi:protein prune homolog 2-like [Varanus komodoensis]|uniref:protein prune homolog 2-like n=1 Tax=Varanus komodoensis TaxID=61221 RepID=UPI001CF7E497|nr:protein prune homolog 2-like [Varanus komodoensis]